jgi:endonuclease/exonuclease/phosphatase family metal-dependent hydrolase
VRLATFNILNGRTPGEDHVDVDRYADAIAALDADVLGLQEVDREQPRSQRADLTAIAAEAMGATHHRFVPALHGTPPSWSAAADDDPEVPAYGVALLSRHPVTRWDVLRLPAAPTRLPHPVPGRLLPVWVRDEPRVAVVAHLETPLGPLQVVVTHLSFLRPSNRVQLRRLVRGLDRRRPTVLMGDLNLGPDPVARLTGLLPLASGATFPSDRPVEQLDHVLASPGIGPARGSVVHLPVSDHRALVADL